ncbi:MAG: LysM domain-containing protein, partial [Chloroflexota bacterium]
MTHSHRKLTVLLCTAGLAGFAAGCTFSQVPAPVATPTVIPATGTVTQTITPVPTVTLSPVPITDTPQAVVEPSDTPLPPTSTPLPTATPGPFEHEIQDGETLGFIVRQYGHRSFDVISEVVRINESIPNADFLPGAGNVILIPRPTTEVIVEEVTESDGPAPGPQPTRRDPGAFTTVHVVQDGETIIDIAAQYGTTLEILSQLNPAINFFGCNFNQPSGGPSCSPFITIGQEINVPAPTPTPTLSPTPDGNETATPTPTFTAPLVVFPPDGAIAQPGRIRLQWVSVGELLENEVYLVYVKDNTLGGAVSAFTTRS